MSLKEKMTAEEFEHILNICYDKAIGGIANIVKPISEVSAEYIEKYHDIEIAAKKMINKQVAKCTTSGFISGLGGVVTLPVTIPTNLLRVMYCQIRMIATAAFMGGYDIYSNEVKSLIYACLAGVSVSNVIKKCGIQYGKKLTAGMLKKLPATILKKINKFVSFKFLTKISGINLLKFLGLVPVVGGVIGGSFDLVETRIVANRAYKWFLNGDFSCRKGVDIFDETEAIEDEELDV